MAVNLFNGLLLLGGVPFWYVCLMLQYLCFPKLLPPTPPSTQQHVLIVRPTPATISDVAMPPSCCLWFHVGATQVIRHYFGRRGSSDVDVQPIIGWHGIRCVSRSSLSGRSLCLWDSLGILRQHIPTNIVFPDLHFVLNASQVRHPPSRSPAFVFFAQPLYQPHLAMLMSYPLCFSLAGWDVSWNLFTY